jgi:hypothetical protein
MAATVVATHKQAAAPLRIPTPAVAMPSPVVATGGGGDDDEEEKKGRVCPRCEQEIRLPRWAKHEAKCTGLAAKISTAKPQEAGAGAGSHKRKQDVASDFDERAIKRQKREDDEHAAQVRPLTSFLAVPLDCVALVGHVELAGLLQLFYPIEFVAFLESYICWVCRVSEMRRAR